MKNGSFVATTTNESIYGTVDWSSYVVEGTNTSNVTATLTLRKYYMTGVTQPTSGTGTWRLYINNVRYEITASKSFVFNSDTVVISNEVTVTHNTDGTKKCNIRVTGGISGTSYTQTYTNSDVDLDNIIVKATILTAPNFLDTANPTLTFSNPSNYPVQFKLEDITDFQHPSDLIVTSKLTNYSGNSYTFNLTSNQREILKTASQNYESFPIRFTVASFIPSSEVNATYWSWLDRTMTVTLSAPTFTNFTHENVDSETLTLTGDSSVYIQNVSQCQVKVPVANKMIAQKNASGKGYTAWVGSYYSWKEYSGNSDVVFDLFDVEDYAPGSVVSVVAFDSRDKNTVVSKPMNIIEYIPNNSAHSASVSERVSIDGKITINASGTYYPIVVGGVEKNTVTVYYNYKENVEGSSWSSDIYMDVNLNSTEGTFVCNQKQIEGLDINKSYLIMVIGDDFHDIIFESDIIGCQPAAPIVYVTDSGKIGINNIPDGTDAGLYLRDTDVFYTRFQTYFDAYLYDDLYAKISKSIYPVGSCFTTNYEITNANDLPVPGSNWTINYQALYEDGVPVIYFHLRTQ